jgi:thiol-disulfide isomerase/thioredoxin
MPITAGRVAMLVCVLLCASPAYTQEQPADFDEKMREGERLAVQRKWEDALRAFKAANGLADKKSPKALIGMAHAYQGLLAHKSAADSCTDALKYTGGDKLLEASARNMRGLSLFALSEKADDKRLKQAEEDFRAVLALTDTMGIARYNLGVVLLKQGRDEEGIPELRAYLETAGRTPESITAKTYIENPRRVRENYAPDFSFTTLEGEHMALEDLMGKVVLIDFWATWCAPCVAATPGLERLQKKLKDDPFIILGVSADRDQAPWKEFIDKHKLSWPQYFDDRRMMASKFRVTGYPTYVLVDHEGVVRYLKLGWSSQVDAEIENNARKLVKQATAAAGK